MYKSVEFFNTSNQMDRNKAVLDNKHMQRNKISKQQFLFVRVLFMTPVIKFHYHQKHFNLILLYPR